MRFSRLRSSLAIATLTASSLALAAPMVASATVGGDTSADTEDVLAALRSSPTAQAAGVTRTERRSTAPMRTEAIQTISDVIGDSLWPQGDIDVAGVDAASTGMVTVAVGVISYDSPFSDSWLYGLTGPVWSLDTNDDLVTDYSVAMVNSDGVVVAGVMPAGGGPVLCAAAPSWDAANRLYGATFPASCIGNPRWFSWQSSFLYEEFVTGVRSFDGAPFPGWAGPVMNDGYRPPAPPTPPAPPAGAGGFESLVPARLLETRPGFATVDGRFNGLGTALAGTTTQLEVAGRGGVPVNATAAVLNVTAVAPRSAGYLTIFPCGSTRPNASSVNFAAGQTVPNAVMTRLGAGGTVCIYAQGTVDLLVDVNGFFSGEQAFSSLNPARVVESRPGLATVDGQFNGIGTQPAGTTLEIVVAGRGGVPVDASSVALNVTAVDARNAGFLTVFPCGTTRPNASSVNFAAGQTVANAVVSRVGAGGRVCIFTQATTDLIVDVNGWFGASSPFTSVMPARLLESRPGLSTVDGVLNATGPSAAGSIRQVSVIGRGGVAPNATAVVLNVTVTGPTSAGFVTVFPCGSALPNASNLNFSAGQTVPNAVVSKVGTNGQVCIYTQATTDLIVDVNGFFL